MESKEIDAHIGNQLRARRIMLGMSQSQLADSVGVTFQQVQKYERGTNRVSASRLYEFASVMHLDISYFFQDIVGHNNVAGFSEDKEEFDHDNSTDREIFLLVRAFKKVEDPDIRKKILGLVRSISES